MSDSGRSMVFARGGVSGKEKREYGRLKIFFAVVSLLRRLLDFVAKGNVPKKFWLAVYETLCQQHFVIRDEKNNQIGELFEAWNKLEEQQMQGDRKKIREEVRLLLQAAKKQYLMNDGEVAFFQELLDDLTTTTTLLEESHSLDDEIIGIGLVYGNCFVELPLVKDEGQQFRNFKITFQHTTQQGSEKSLELLIRIPPQYPLKEPSFSFGHSVGLQNGDLQGLKVILQYKAAVLLGRQMLFPLFLIIQNYLSSMSELSSQAESFDPLPFMPPSHQLAEIQWQEGGLVLDFLSLAVLDSAMNAILRKKIGKTSLQVVHVENIISQRHLAAFYSKLMMFNQRGDKILAPTVAFHATTERANVDSIVANNLVVPGDRTADGKLISVETGSSWGCGIYLSPNFEFSDHYSFRDSENYRQMFMSLVLLGKPYNAQPNDDLWDKWLMDSYDSHISPDRQQFVIFDSPQILPCLLITYGPPGRQTKSQFEKAEVSKRIPFDAVPEEEKRKLDSVWFELIPGTTDKFCFTMSEDFLTHHSIVAPKTEVHLLYLLDKSKSMGRSFKELLLPACSLLHRTMQPHKATTILFGRTVDAIKVNSASFFESEKIKETTLEDATNILGACLKALEIAYADNDAYKNQAEEELFDEVTSLEQSGKLKKPTKCHDMSSKDMSPEELNLQQIEEDLKSEKRVFAEMRRARNRDWRELLFIFILMSDGKDTINTEQMFRDHLSRHSKELEGSRMNVAFIVVGIGKRSNTAIGMQIKLALQTVQLWETTPVFYAKNTHELPMVIANVCQFSQRVVLQNSVHLSVRDVESHVYRGFITNLTHPPRMQTSLRLKLNEDSCVLFKGLPPKKLRVNGESIPVLLSDKITRPNIVLRLLQSLVLDVKVAAVAGRDITESINELTKIIKTFGQLQFDVKQLELMTPNDRLAMMKKKKQLINELEMLLNTLKEVVLIAKSKMNSEQQALWLIEVSKMKYGGKAIRRASMVDMHQIIEELIKIDSSHLEEKPTDRKSHLSLRTATGHLTEITSNHTLLQSNPSLTDLLYSFGMVGLGITVRRSEAANINPWNIQVDRVSQEYIDTASAMCALDAGYSNPLDVLVIVDPRNPKPYKIFIRTKLYQSYLGVVFTRNPDLHLPGQKMALMMVTLVRSVEHLFDVHYRNIEHVETIFHMIYSLKLMLNNNPEKQMYGNKLVSKLLQPQPGRFMTESEEDDIVSVVKILCALCCIDSAEELFHESQRTQFQEVALAIMAEAVSRGVRVKIKTDKLSSRQLLQQALNINPHSIVIPQELKKCGIIPDMPGDFDVNSARKHSGKFFRDRWSNASPQAVVAMISLAEFIHKVNFNASYLLDETLAKDIFFALLDSFQNLTMRSFIQKYASNCEPLDVQIALYVQGLRYHNSRSRKDGLPSLTNSLQIIAEIAKQERIRIFTDKVKERLKEEKITSNINAKLVRFVVKKQEQSEFLLTHKGIPRLFTHAEVAELNLKRPANDQLELTQSMLLKHHCGYSNCPAYLQNFSTEKDRVLGRRSGLFAHLKYFFVPEKIPYYKGFHHVAIDILQRNTLKRETFIDLCMSRLNIASAHYDIYADYLINIWHSSQKK